MEETWEDIRSTTRPLGFPPSRHRAMDKEAVDKDLAPPKPSQRFLSLRRLQRGEYNPQITLDLHGLTLIQAHDRLQQTLHEAMDQKQRLLLIITGKGNNSQPHTRTLKESFDDWMMIPPFCRLVGHVCPAAKRHGGAGAYYVLLKKS